MGRKHRDEDRVPAHRQKSEQERRPRRGGRLAVLLALAGAAAYLVRRNKRKAELDEGIWHEAPASAAPAFAAPASAGPASAAPGSTTPSPSA